MGDVPGGRLQANEPDEVSLPSPQSEDSEELADSLKPSLSLVAIKGIVLRQGSTQLWHLFDPFDPFAIAVTGDLVIITDRKHDGVLIWDQEDFKYWGSIGTGTGSNPGQFRKPSDVIINGDYLYVSDSGNHRIQVFNLQSGMLEDIYGGFGYLPGDLRFPCGLAIRKNELYVAESGNGRISVFRLHTGTFVRSFGLGKGSSPGQIGGGFPFLSFSEDFNELFMTDPLNCRIEVFEPITGKFLREFGGKELAYPTGILTIRDEIYVSDSSHDQICTFTQSGELLRCFGSYGDKNNEFSFPIGLAAWDGELFVCDEQNRRVQTFR